MQTLANLTDRHTDADDILQFKGVISNGFGAIDSNEQMPSPTPYKQPPSPLPEKHPEPKEGVSPGDAQIPDDQDAKLTGQERTHQATNDEDIVGPDSNRG